MAERIYEVINNATGISRLIIAGSQAQAIRHVAGDTFDVCVPSAMEVAALMKDGVVVETCGDKQAELPIEDAA